MLAWMCRWPRLSKILSHRSARARMIAVRTDRDDDHDRPQPAERHAGDEDDQQQDEDEDRPEPAVCRGPQMKAWLVRVGGGRLSCVDAGTSLVLVTY